MNTLVNLAGLGVLVLLGYWLYQKVRPKPAAQTVGVYGLDWTDPMASHTSTPAPRGAQ
jgi:hypothetical protein